MLSHNSAFDKNNNLNLIRIYLSLSVVLYHSYELSKNAGLGFLVKFFNGESAVEAFFIISGFLVMKSYYRSQSVKSFFIKRLKRIYPAYVTIILLCAILGVLVTTNTASRYFSSPDFYRYLFSNLFFLNFIHPDLPGVFANNPFTAVNGSLWTLKIEVGYYLLVPLIVMLRSKINTHLLYGMLFVLSLGYFMGMKHLYLSSGNNTYLFLSRQIPGQLFYFILGAWAVEWERTTVFANVISWFGIPAIIVLWFPMPAGIQCILQAIGVFFFAYIVPRVNYPYKDEDISYGLYIYHFPVIQVLVYYQLYDRSPFVGLALSLLTTIALAVLSWVFIEKTFIVKKWNGKLALN